MDLKQENYYNEIQNIKSRTKVSLINDDDIRETYKRFLSKAFNTTHRRNNSKNYDLLSPYAIEATIDYINILGSQGMTSRTEGSISTTFKNISDEMRKNLIEDGLRKVK